MVSIVLEDFERAISVVSISATTLSNGPIHEGGKKQLVDDIPDINIIVLAQRIGIDVPRERHIAFREFAFLGITLPVD